MREVAQAVINELNLDYRITMVSGGGSGNHEIVIWDRPRNSYFSVRFTWSPALSDDDVASTIRRQLRERIASHDLVGDRRPVRRWSAA